MPAVAKKEAVPSISEADVTKYALDKKLYEKAKKELDALKTDLDIREKTFIHLLDAGAVVKSKIYRLAVDRSTTRRNVDWAGILDGLWRSMGVVPEIARAKKLQETEPTVYPKLTVQENS